MIYLIIIAILLIITIKLLNRKREGIDEYSCDSRHEAISKYPNNETLDVLFNATFKPECCPTPYSSSTGCLCLDIDHSELIKMRGGNRIMC
jgi:hypothetical protein